MIITILFIISLFVIVALIIALNKQLKKIDAYEQISEEYNAAMSRVVDWIYIALNKLHEIDRKQIFEGDDDVGWFFQTLKYQITELNNKIASIFGETIDDTKKDKEKKE